MKKTMTLSAFFLLVGLCGSGLNADVLHGGGQGPVFALKPSFSADHEVVFEFNLPQVSDAVANLTAFGKGKAVTLANTHMRRPEPGCPNVQGLQCLVQVPYQGAVDIHVSGCETRHIDNVTISPAQHPSLIGYDTQFPYTINQAVYGTDAFYPSAVVTLKSCEVLRELRVAVVNVNPVRYNPVAKRLELVTRAYITVRPHAGVRGQNELQLADRALTPDFLPLYQDVINFDKAQLRHVRTTPGCYVFMGSEANLDAVKDLITWKKQKGYVVKTAVPGKDGVPTDTEGIHQWIEEAYKNWNPKPEYLLLVGNESVIPPKTYVMNMMGHRFASDNAFGVIGSGNVPSISVGRITGNKDQANDDPEVLKYLAWKILKHDKEPEGDWRNNAMAFGCHSQQNNDGVGVAIQKEWVGHISKLMTVTKGSDKTSEEGGKIMNSAMFIDRLNKGASLVTYIGHGNMDVWSNLRFSIKSIDRLANDTKFPVIFSLACMSGAWKDQHCLYENFLDKGSIQAPKGAVGVFGYATFSTDNVGGLISHALSNCFEKGIYRIGPCLLDTKNFAITESDAQSGTIFGCPEIGIYTAAQLKTPQIEHGALKAGACNVTVKADDAPLANAMVGVVDAQNELLGSAITDEKGSATLDLKGVTPGADVTLTVTGFNCKPLIKTVKGE